MGSARLGDAAEVARLASDVLGAQLLGAYLHGSATLGGLRPHSDLDVLCVVAGPVPDAQRRALVHAVLQVSGSRAPRGPSRPVELTVVVRDDLCPWRYPPVCEFQYGEWLREEYEAGVLPRPHADPDLAVLVTMVLLADAALLGPPARTLLDPVPSEDLSAALVAGVPGLLDALDTDTANVLLTLARIWMTLSTGRITAKDAAADWAAERIAEQRAALDHARAVYRGEAPDEWTRLRDAAHVTAGALVQGVEALGGRRGFHLPDGG